MADNVTANAGAGGATLASDDIGGVQYPRAKLAWGVDGAAVDASATNPLPIQVRNSSGTEIGTAGNPIKVDLQSTATITGTVTANAGTGPFPVSDNSGSLTVDAPVGTPVATRLSDGSGFLDFAVFDLDSGAGTDNTIAVALAVAASGGAVAITGDAANGLDVDVTRVSGTVTISGTVTANAGTNLNTSALALEGGGNLAGAATSLAVIDDWDESDRAKVNLVVGQAGISAGAGAVAANTPRLTLASDDPAVALLGTIDTDTGNIATSVQLIDDGVATIGSAVPTKAMAAAGTDGTNARLLKTDTSGELQIDVLTIPAVTNAGTFAVQESGAALTALQLIDDAVATTGAAVPGKGIAAAGTDGTNARLLKTDAAGELQVDVLTLPNVTIGTALPAGTNAIGKLAANSGVDIGDVDVTSLPALAAGDNTVGRMKVTDGTTVATVRDLTNSKPLNVSIVDANGDQITSFGGSGGTSSQDDSAFTAGSGSGTPMMGFVTADSVDSGDVGVVGMLANRQLKVTLFDSGGVEQAVGGGTQYTEDAAAAANPVGNAMIAVRDDSRGGSLTTTDGDNVALRGTNAGELYVKHVDTIPVTQSGAWTITANAGTNLNTSLLALEAGGNLAGAATSLAVLDDWDESDRAKVNLVVGQAGVSAGAGAVAANTPRITLASDDPGVALLTTIDADTSGIITAVQLIDDAIVADDAAFTPATTKVMMAGYEYDDTTPDSVNEGDAGAARMSANRNIYTQIRDAAGNERGVNVNASNQLTVSVDNTVTVAAHAVTNAGTFAVQESGGALTALQIIDDWDESDRAKVNLIAGQAGVTGGAGAVAANTVRATLASDDPGVALLGTIDADTGGILTSVQLIDDAIVADDAAFTPATTKVMMAGFEFDDTTPDSVNEGDAGAARMSANRNIYTTIRDAAGNERGVNVDSSNRLSVSVDNTVTVGSHAVTNAGTFVTQENGAALTALQLIDDGVATIGSAVPAKGMAVAGTDGTNARLLKTDTSGELQVDVLTLPNVTIGAALPAGTNAIGKLAANSGVDIGDVDVTSLPALATGSNVIGYVGLEPRTSGGVSVSKTVSAASTNATSVKGSAGQLFGWALSNVNAAARYLKLYNKASAPTVGTDTPVMTLIIPGNTAGAGQVQMFDQGIAFGTGIAFALTTEATDAGSTGVAANEIVVNLFYK